MTPAFLTPLDLRELRGEYDGGRQKFMLLAPLVYTSAIAGQTFTAPAGFVSDAESVPRVFVPTSGAPCLSAGVIHDWLYGSHVCDKDVADAVYGEALTVLGLDPVYVSQRVQAVSFWGDNPLAGRPWSTGPSRLRVLNPGLNVVGLVPTLKSDA